MNEERSSVAEPAGQRREASRVKDPVCGMTVDPLTSLHTAVHRDQTYWFCSAGCEAEFLKEPERYLRAIEADT